MSRIVDKLKGITNQVNFGHLISKINECWSVLSRRWRKKCFRRINEWSIQDDVGELRRTKKSTLSAVCVVSSQCEHLRISRNSLSGPMLFLIFSPQRSKIKIKRKRNFCQKQFVRGISLDVSRFKVESIVPICQNAIKWKERKLAGFENYSHELQLWQLLIFLIVKSLS